MDRLAAIRVFVAVADAGSLSAAGQRLGMPLTTVSRHLKALEEAVSVRLLTRTTRRLALTEPGRAYLDTCRRVLDELGTAERHLAGEKAEPHGQLALTAPILFGRLHVRPVVSAYLEAHPQMSVRMVLVNRVVNLVEEGLDLSIRIGRLPDSSMRATTLGSVRQICCASPRYLKCAGVPPEPKDLLDHQCITFTSFSQPDRWVFPGGEAQGRRKAQNVAVEPRLVVNTAEAAIDAAKDGLGIVRVLSYQAQAALKDGSLRRVLEAFEPEPIPVSLVHREDRLPQAKVQTFSELAVPRLRKALKDV
ncbi:MAG: LysR family transcriptional regulator [Methyloceanibacter sp.]|uniref:LysR family transcriptional regulator n=1 Tax=Methyloceanibacter sp. TaxID=1965321 RepID=UPI001D36E650|nr:LysR family transcriptional regulator [Methyloceanibacter sp.]MCB1441451.1 LysR family transcriptional regulator [Methyloceanibacter sp.]